MKPEDIAALNESAKALLDGINWNQDKGVTLTAMLIVCMQGIWGTLVDIGTTLELMQTDIERKLNIDD